MDVIGSKDAEVLVLPGNPDVRNPLDQALLPSLLTPSLCMLRLEMNDSKGRGVEKTLCERGLWF